MHIGGRILATGKKKHEAVKQKPTQNSINNLWNELDRIGIPVALTEYLFVCFCFLHGTASNRIELIFSVWAMRGFK